MVESSEDTCTKFTFWVPVKEIKEHDFEIHESQRPEIVINERMRVKSKLLIQ